ncbi:MAG: glycoside hydrolase family 38 C-terminal domain-containing protein, partial [Sarcina sp.]
VQQMTEILYKDIIGSEKEGMDNVLICNSLSWEREEWVKLYDKWTKVKINPLSSKVISKNSIEQYCNLCTFNVSKDILENSLIKVEFNDDGSIKSVYDKEVEREILKTNKNNTLEVYEDNGDAWDFSQVYKDRPSSKFKIEKVSFKIEGPRAIVTQKYTYNKSTLKQNIIIAEGSKRVDFETTVDWQEDGKMLRTSFNTNIHTREATCEIQFGNIKRPTHDNTSWDMAKGEICAHKWVDLSQRDYGVALLNDCKYGYNISETTIDLNLLRSPAYPDPNADRGEHKFTYSLLPHKGDYIEGDVVKEAYNFNIPLQVIYTDKDNKVAYIDSLLDIDCENVIVESVKKAEFSDDIIVRLYECHGCNAKAKINLNFKYANIEL